MGIELRPQQRRNSVKTAGSGLKMDITGFSADRGSYRVHIYKK